MKRAVWLVIGAVVVAAAVWGLTEYGDRRLDRRLEKLHLIDDPPRAIAAAAEFLRVHPRLDEARTAEAVAVAVNAAFEAGEFDGLVSTIDSLVATDLPSPAVSRLLAELHDVLVIRGSIFGNNADLERANGIVRDLLLVSDLPGEAYLTMASMRAGLMGDSLALSEHYLAIDLARRGYADAAHDTLGLGVATLDSAHRALLEHVAGARGVEAALALADSFTAGSPDPTMAGLMMANRYRLTVESDSTRAVAAARGLAGLRGRFTDWRVPDEIGFDLSERGLDHGLALALCEWSLSLAPSRRESARIHDHVGLVHRAALDHALAAEHFEAAVAGLDDVPTLGDRAVQHLLESYDSLGAHDPAIDLLGRIIARSVLPNEEARERLADLLASAGRSADEMPKIVSARRYAGVAQAPPFVVTMESGRRIALAQLRGRVVLLCFWSYT